MNQLQGQMMATWQENVTFDSSQDLMECISALLSLHLFSFLACPLFFFCLLIFSFSLAFVPSLREPSLFNAWPPNSSTPRCTTPSFLCFVHPLHSSVVHHSTIPLNLLFLFSWTGEILKRVFLAQEKCGQNFTKTTWCYRARVLNLNIDDD